MIRRLTNWALVVLIASAALSVAGCGDARIGSPMADNDGPEAMDVGNRAFEAQLYDTALNAYSVAQESMPDRSEPVYNSANTLYMQEQFSEAVKLYDRLLEGQDLELAGRTTYNAANALYGAGEHEQAIEMYKQALRYDPSDLDAKHNLELALAHRVEPQPPQQQEAPQEQPQQEQGEQGQQEESDEGELPPGQPQDGEPQPGENEGEPQEGDGEGDDEEEAQSGEPGNENATPNADAPQWPIIPPSGMTEEQAIQILESVGENTQPLRNAIVETGRFNTVRSGPPPPQDW